MALLQGADGILQQVFQRLGIGARHILLATSEEADGVSAQILHSFGVKPERLGVVLLDVRAIAIGGSAASSYTPRRRLGAENRTAAHTERNRTGGDSLYARPAAEILRKTS